MVNLMFLLNNFKASELQVVGFTGSRGIEKLNFFTPLKSYSLQRVSEWFDHLSKIIKSSMSLHTQTYLNKIETYSGKFE